MIVARPEIVEHIVLNDVSWEAYERLLVAMGNQRFRHSYDRGTLEIVPGHGRHQRLKCFTARLLEAASLALNVDIQSLGSTTLTLRSKRRGLEPDDCYYIQHEAEVRSRKEYDPQRDPPPDVAIDVEIGYASVNRRPIFAALNVPELWRVKDETVSFWQLKRGRYISTARSLAFPMLAPDLLTSYIRRRFEASDTKLVGQFVNGVKKEARRHKS